MKKVSLFLVLFAMAFGFVSCETEKDSITVYNDTWADIKVVVDGGAPTTIAYDKDASFEVDDLAEVIVTATAEDIYGETVVCNVYEEDAETFGVSVPAEYFHLQIVHNKQNKPDIDRLIVNAQNSAYKTDETIDPALVYGADVNNDIHYIGYYRALSGCKIYAYAGAKSDWWLETSNAVQEYHFTFPGVEDQAILLQTEELINLKKKAATATALVKQRRR